MAGWRGYNPRVRTGVGRPAGQAVSVLCHTLEEESDRWFLWVPVFFGLGIGLYFGLEKEPPVAAAVALLCLALSLCAGLRTWPLAGAFAVAGLCAALGFADAKLRTALVSQPALSGNGGVATLNGWVEKTESRHPRGHRITVRLLPDARAASPGLPYCARITSRFDAAPRAGEAISLRAVLKPIPEPAMPGGFDYSRKAYFSGLGALGFAIAEAEPLSGAPHPPWDIRLRAFVDNVRHGVEQRIFQALPGERGAITAALITGERGRIPEETLQALRDSGLAHLLAISGMHMALMAGTLYWLLRAIAAAIPPLALRYPIKKWAAVLALLGGAFYLALSGGAVATQRAFLMMAIVFTAVLLDRPAFTLRNVALAACVILALYPESLLDVSFQMSFAAVTGLIAVYERVERRPVLFGAVSWPVRLLRKAGWYVAGIALTTLVASIAIAPFAAYHFHKLAQYSLLANLAAMPVFGLAVMPAALVSLTAMPLGLEAWPLTLMAWGIERITAIAEAVSGWDGATIEVATMPLASLLALVVGGLWVALWRTRWRVAGVAITSIGVLTAGSLPRPDLLIGREGELLALRADDDGLAVTGASRPNYSLEQWLRADGDGRDPADALKGKDFACDELACVARVKGKTLAFVHHPAALAEECARADIVVSKVPLNRSCPKARVSVDRIDLWSDGAHALYFDGQSIRVETVAELRGDRPWSRMLARKRKKAAPEGTAFAGEETPRNE